LGHSATPFRRNLGKARASHQHDLVFVIQVETGILLFLHEEPAFVGIAGTTF